MRGMRVSISFVFIKVCLQRNPLRFVSERRFLYCRLATGHYPTIAVAIVLSLSLSLSLYPPPTYANVMAIGT
jgi:hypothetical protein